MSDYTPSSSEKDAFGAMIASSRFGGTILGSALYGIQFFMVFSNLSAFLGRSREARQGHLRYTIISCLILVTFSVNFSIDTWRTFRILFSGGPEPQSYTRAYVNDETRFWTSIFAGDVMICITIAVGDILMLWRCFILWSHKKWVVLFPCLTCVGAIACYITYLVLSANLDEVTQAMVKAVIAAASLSVATNIMVTVLILLRLLLAWRHASKVLPDRKTPRMYSDAVGILVEAAVPLAVFGICFITMAFIDHLDGSKTLLSQGRIWVLNEVFGRFYYSFCALSPQMIIYRVASGRSWKDTTESRARETFISQPIHFSHTSDKSHKNDASNSSSGIVEEDSPVQLR